MSIKSRAFFYIVGCVFCLGFSQIIQSAEGKSPLISESYYQVKWGYFDEFVALFRKNHYPILKEMQRLGHVESIVIEYPTNHVGEVDRWDMRVTVTIPDTSAYKRAMKGVSARLYPDQEKLKTNESERFKLLLGHRDIMIRRQDLSNW